MTIIAAGSSLQIVIALLIVLVNMLLVLKLAPFQDVADDWLSFLSSFQMFITLLVGLLLMMDTQEQKDKTYDQGSMGSLLIFVNSLGFFAFALSLALLHPKMRAWVDRLGTTTGSKNGATRAGAKVVPKSKEHTELELQKLRQWGGPDRD